MQFEPRGATKGDLLPLRKVAPMGGRDTSPTMHLLPVLRRRGKLLPEEDRKGAWSIYEALRIFTKETRNDMPLQYVTSFLLVAMEEGLSVTEYAEKARLSKSVMSRHLLDIGPRMRNDSTGFGLLETRVSLEDVRRHEVYLSAKGRALLSRILRFWRSSKG